MQRIFKLRSEAIAILPESGGGRTVVTIPANSVVRLVVGNIAEDGFVFVRYRNQTLVMFSVDLRSRAERQLEESA